MATWCAEYNRKRQQKRPFRVSSAAPLLTMLVRLAWLKSESEHRFRFARLRCAVSRVLFRQLAEAAMYLGWPLPTTSSGTFVRPNWFPTNTALHRSKNFAVAPTPFDVIIPEGILPLSGSASLFASLASRRTGVTPDVRVLPKSGPLTSDKVGTSGPLPCCPKGACVRTFLPDCNVGAAAWRRKIKYHAHGAMAMPLCRQSLFRERRQNSPGLRARSANFPRDRTFPGRWRAKRQVGYR